MFQMAPARVISTYIGVWDFYSSVLEGSLSIEPTCRNVQQFDTCYELCFVVCDFLNFVTNICWMKEKNKHGLGNTKNEVTIRHGVTSQKTRMLSSNIVIATNLNRF